MHLRHIHGAGGTRHGADPTRPGPRLGRRDGVRRRQRQVPGLRGRRAADPLRRLLRRAPALGVPRLVSLRFQKRRAPTSRRTTPAGVPARSSAPPSGASPATQAPGRTRRSCSPASRPQAGRFGGIQHWGMNDAIDALDVARAYPRLDAWRRVRWALTDGGTSTTFDSDFTRRCGPSSDRRSWSRPPTTTTTARPTRGLAPERRHWYVIDSSGGTSARGNWGAARRHSRARRLRRRRQDRPRRLPPDQRHLVRHRQLARRATPHAAVGPGRRHPGARRLRRRRQDRPRGLPPVDRHLVRHQQLDRRASRSACSGASAGDIPVPGDYDGDGKTDLAVFRPSTGTWYVIDSSTRAPAQRSSGAARRHPRCPATTTATARPTSPSSGPSDGDVVRASTAATGSTAQTQWGEPGDIPVPGDYDGDGKTDLAVWRPSNGTWYVINSKDGSKRTRSGAASATSPCSPHLQFACRPRTGADLWPAWAAQCRVDVSATSSSSTRLTGWTPNDGFFVRMTPQGRVTEGSTRGATGATATRTGLTGSSAFGENWKHVTPGFFQYACQGRRTGLTCTNHRWARLVAAATAATGPSRWAQ